MILTARIACIGYLVLLVGIAILSIFTSKPPSSAYFIGFIVGLLLFMVIFSAAALATLRALGATSPTRLRRASIINKIYLLLTVVAILTIVVARAAAPHATIFIPACVLVGLIAAISIAGLSKAQKQLAVAH
jgi:hypothetical protein